MANTDSPFGLVAIGTTDGSDYHGKMRKVAFLAADAVAAFIGDPIKLTTAGTTADGETPVVAAAAAGDAFAGVLVSLTPTFEDEGSLTLNHRLASTARTGFALFGSDVLYTVQEDSDAGALTASDAGQNIDIIKTVAGDTITGISGVELDSSTVLNASGQLRLHYVDREIDNELGTNAKWIVTINEDQDDHGAGVA